MNDNHRMKVIGWAGGSTLLGILFITLVILKVMGKTRIHWIWVFSPIWIPFIIALVLGVIIALTGKLKTEGLKTKDTETS